MGLFIDKLSGQLFLFDITSSGSTGGSGSTYQEVETFGDLPSAASAASKILVVRTSTGTYMINRKEAGMYYSNGATWRRLGDIPSFFNDDNFQIYDGNDTSKRVQFQISGLTPSVTRVVTLRDSDGTMAYLSDVTIKLNTSVFNGYTGTTAPATYLTKSSFNSYSASTLTNINSRLLTSSFNVYSAATLTNINSRLLISAFTGYSATTLVNINSRLLSSVFSTYSANTATKINFFTGTTAPNTYQSKSSIVTLTGTTLPATYVSKVAYNAYTAATNTTLNLTITGATNGLSKTGRNVKLGGTVTGNTTIGLGSNNITITGGTGSTVITTNIQSALTGAFYLGNSSTNGSWRITTSGNDLVFQYRESGSWVTKFTIASS